jgi:hypothetical protein
MKLKKFGETVYVKLSIKADGEKKKETEREKQRTELDPIV